MSQINEQLVLKFFIDGLLQKDVDLSKDDLLGDILQDLHSEVRVITAAETLPITAVLIRNLVLSALVISFLFLSENKPSEPSPRYHSEKKEVSWTTFESILRQTPDSKGIIEIITFIDNTL